MAINFEKLIDLSLLNYYDEKIKTWVASTIAETINTVVFVNGDLPTQGEEGVLYITKTSIKYWDGASYVELSGSAESATWGEF